MIRTPGVALIALTFFVYSAEMDFSSDDMESPDAIPSGLMKAAEEAYGCNMRGLEALEKGDLQAAHELFSEAMDKFPGYSDAQNNLGVVYFRKGDVGQAEEIWRALAGHDPAYALARHNLGIVAFHEKRYDDAAAYFEEALKTNKKLAQSYIMLGRIQVIRGKDKAALDYFGKAYKINPAHPDAWGFMAYGYIHAGDTAKALSILEAHKDHPTALEMLGTLAAAHNQLGSAQGYLEKAANQGADPSILVKLASVQIDAGDCQKAKATIALYFSREQESSADAYLTAGNAFMECGAAKEAQNYLEQGLEKFPADGLLRYNLGKVYFLANDYEQAERTWRGLSDTLHDPDLFFMRAASSLKRKSYNQAEARIRHAIDLSPKASYHDLLGVVLHKQGRTQDAIAEFNEALRIDPSLRSAQINLSLISKSAKDIEKAIKEVEKQRAGCSSNCADLALQLAVLYHQQQRTSEAASLLNGLADKDKSDQVLRTLAFFYKETQQWDKAIQIIEKLAQRSPRDPQAQYDLAEVYVLAGHYARGIDVLSTLTSVWKDPSRVYYQLGYAYLEQNMLDKAKSNLEVSLQRDPQNSAAQGLLAYIFSQKGETDKAKKLWEKNLKSDPDNPVVMTNLGLAAENAGHYEEALGHYQKALSLSKGDNAIYINIGNTCTAMGKFGDAEAAYKKALTSSKRDGAAYNLFNIARKTDDRSKADQMIAVLNREFPGAIATQRARGELSLWNGDTAAGLTTLEALAEKDVDDSLQLAAIYARKGDGAQTAAYLKIAQNDPVYRSRTQDILGQLAFCSRDFARAYDTWKTLDDTSFGGQYNLALSAFEAGFGTEALDAAEKLSRKADPAFQKNVWRLAGNAAFKLKDWKKAREWYQKLSAQESHNGVVFYNLSVACYNLGDIDDSYRYYQSARKIDPTISNKDIENRYEAARHAGDQKVDTIIDPFDALYNKAVGLQGKGKNRDAEKIYREIVEKNPSHAPSWNNLGAIYAAQNKLDKAEEAYLHAVQDRHDIPEAYANLANIYLALDKVDDAKQWLMKGLEFNPGNELLLDMQKRAK
jgi:tetratricopeptide (TPR) repeat protein